jgi:hypothetical protein
MSRKFYLDFPPVRAIAAATSFEEPSLREDVTSGRGEPNWCNALANAVRDTF